MERIKEIASGFLVSISVICFFITFGWLPYYIDSLIALILSLSLAIPLLIRGVKFLKKILRIKQAQNLVFVAKKFIMSVQGVALACWVFDIVTTFFSVNARGNVEINPLGWPFGIIGAAVYYIPAIIGVNYLLFKSNSKGLSFFVALIITAVTLFMASNNFNAGFLNFANLRLFTDIESNLELMTTWLVSCVALTTLNMIAVLKNRNNQQTSITTTQNKI